MERIIFDNSALRTRIMKDYGTIKAFAEAVHMSPRSLGSRLNNHTYFTIDEIGKIRRIFNMNNSEVDHYFFTKQYKPNKLQLMVEMLLDMTDDQQRMMLAIMKGIIDDPEGTMATLSKHPC